MKQLKIALTALAAESGISQENWKTVPLKGADLTDVSAVVMTSRDEIPAAYDTIHAFSIPLFIDIKVTQEPLLRAIIPFCISQFAIPFLYEPIISWIIGSFRIN